MCRYCTTRHIKFQVPIRSHRRSWRVIVLPILPSPLSVLSTYSNKVALLFLRLSLAVSPQPQHGSPPNSNNTVSADGKEPGTQRTHNINTDLLRNNEEQTASHTHTHTHPHHLQHLHFANVYPFSSATTTARCVLDQRIDRDNYDVICLDNHAHYKMKERRLCLALLQTSFTPPSLHTLSASLQSLGCCCPELVLSGNPRLYVPPFFSDGHDLARARTNDNR